MSNAAKTYSVTVSATGSYRMTVKAESPEQAIAVALRHGDWELDAESLAPLDDYQAEPIVDAEDACGNCRGSLTEDDLCGYGGHDLNELFDESLPESERMRCCGCLADLTGECCCPECSN